MAQADEAKRATTAITIAQLKFKQRVKTGDLEARLAPILAESCSQFFSALDAVLAQNTHVNIQTCTDWIIKHIAPSRTRIAALGDYLASISRSLVVGTSSTAAKKAVRNRIDLLLVLNNALHTDRYHSSSAKHGLLGTELTSHLAELVELAAVCATKKDSQVEKKLRAIINYWAVNNLISSDARSLVIERADEGFLHAQGGTPVRKRNYLLPEYHGDKKAPWYELPASYMLEQMVSHPNRPLDPHRIKVTRFDKKPVSTHVRKLLDNYFEDIDLKHTPTGDNPSDGTKKYVKWLDPMGQVVKRDRETSETRTPYNGYGWSMQFCQDMQKDGLPKNIKTLRDDAERMDAISAREHDQWRHSRSPRRRQRSSSPSSRRRDWRDRSGSDASRSSYDSRSRSGSRHRDDRQRSPRNEERGRRNHNRDWEQVPDLMRQGSRDENQYSRNAPRNFTPKPPQAPHPPFNAPPWPSQPHMPNQSTGPFSMQHFPAPMPFHPGGIFPPPLNFNGTLPPPPPSVAAMSNTSYSLNNQWNQFPPGNPQGFNQQNQSGFQSQNFNQNQYQNQSQGQGGFQDRRGGHGGHQPGGGDHNIRGGYGGGGRNQPGGGHQNSKGGYGGHGGNQPGRGNHNSKGGYGGGGQRGTGWN